MELKETPSMVTILILLALIIGIGVLVTDKFANSSRLDTTIIDEQVTANVSTTLTNIPVKSIASVSNRSDAADLITNYTLTSNKIIVLDIDFNGSLVNITYVYEAPTAATTSIRAGRDAIGDFASDWMAVIVVVIAAAIILSLVMGAFILKRR